MMTTVCVVCAVNRVFHSVTVRCKISATKDYALLTDVV